MCNMVIGKYIRDEAKEWVLVFIVLRNQSYWIFCYKFSLRNEVLCYSPLTSPNWQDSSTCEYKRDHYWLTLLLLQRMTSVNLFYKINNNNET